MGKINILPSKVYNRIAAGEVVERPSSVVKELIENSIDAGATEIEIHIEKGGKQLIQVVDNGCGIERDDLHSAFLPHATSKIAQAEDLENIMTLGFRGEAIASIASVSKMTIISQTENGKCYRIHSNGGEISRITEVAGEKGTRVCVEMLFFNAPVRLNFLKTDKGEETEITSCISRFILNRSDIAFRYYIDGKQALQSFGDSDEEALIGVYGAAVLRECIAIDAEKYGVRIRGYIGNQHFYKANKTYQSVFLNGRYIVNATIASAISNAYTPYLMKRQYPFYVLHIDIPQELVDVNVHPNKADVRFADNGKIYGCIYSIISSVLDGNSKALEYVVKDPEVKESVFDLSNKEEKADAENMPKSNLVGFSPVDYEESKKQIKACEDKIFGDDTQYAPPSKTSVQEEENPAIYEGYVYEKGAEGVKDSTFLQEMYPDLYFNPKGSKIQSSSGEGLENSQGLRGVKDWRNFDLNEFIIQERIMPQAKEEALNKSKGVGSVDEKEDAVVEGIDTPAGRIFSQFYAKNGVQEQFQIKNYNYIGKIFNTYLLYQRDQEIFIIDQHAAHERIIFDKLRQKMRERTVVVQPLLAPYEIPMNHFEADFIMEHQQDLLDMGITIVHHQGEKYRVTTLPLDLIRMNIGSFLHAVLAEINPCRALKAEELVRDKLAALACKAAIKGGMDITRQEINDLFKQLEGNMGLKCPHGRPVVVTLTKQNIEKMFKRIR